MRPALVRALLFLATILVVWTAAPRAFASVTRAPVCDPRGAIMFAPPPQIQDLEQSLDIVYGDDCASPDKGETHQVERGRAPQGAADTSSQEPTNGSRTVPIVGGDGARVPAPEARAERVPPGHRTPLDRPPRA